MAACDFYASGDDGATLLYFLFQEVKVIAFELSTHEPPVPLESVGAVARRTLDSRSGLRLQLWSPAVCPPPSTRRVEVRGAKRHVVYHVEGAGLMQLYLAPGDSSIIRPSHFGCWSQAGARARCVLPTDGCDWRALTRAANGVIRHLRTRVAVGFLHRQPVLPGAWSAVTAGARLWHSGVEHTLDAVRRVKAPALEDTRH